MIYMDGIDESASAFFSQKVEGLPLPKALRLQLTSFCNMHCTMCPCSHSQERHVVSDAVLRKIVDVCAPHIGAIGMSYLGEPTLHPDFWGVVDFLSKNGKWEIGLQTNGTTLTEGFCQKLIASPIESVSVSLDTLDPKCAEHYRPGTRHVAIRDGILQLLSLKERKRPELKVILRVFSDEIKNQKCDAFFREVLFWKEHGCYAISPGRMFNHAGAITQIEDSCVACRKHECPCIFPWYYLVIGVNGEIRPCCMDVESKMTLSNILCIHDLPAFWNGPEMRRFRAALLDPQKRNVLCESCNWRKLVSPLEACPW